MQILPSGNPEEWSLGNIEELIRNIATLALAIAGGIAIILILYGAISYLTAFGNEEKVASAKKTITWAIIGLVVIALAELIIAIVWGFITPTAVPTVQ